MLVVGDVAQIERLVAIVGGPPRTVETSDDMSQAMDRISRGGVDVVLLDLSLMPGDIAMSVVDAAKMDAPNTDSVVLVDPETPHLVATALERGAAFALVRPPEDGMIARVLELVLRARSGTPSHRVKAAVDAIAGAQNERRLRARVLEWAHVLTSARGSTLYRLDDRDIGRSFVYQREHPEQVEAIAPDVLKNLKPVVLMGTPDERVTHNIPAEARHGPALFRALDTKTHASSVLAVVREEGSAPFTRAEVDNLSVVAHTAALAFDRLAFMQTVESRSDELERVQQKLKTAEKSQGVGEIATGYAHQIQAPLQYLQSQLREALEVLEGMDQSEAARKALSYARDGADRVQAVVGELSLLGRSRSDTDIPVDRLVGIAVKITKARTGIEIVEEIENVSVVGNVTNLAHALHQIIDNAVAAAETSVTIRAFQFEEDRCHIVVSDDGFGMPSNVTNRIFERFFTTKEGAPGLGLPTARDLITEAGGGLSVESKLGSGTKARLDLPLAESGNTIPLPDKFKDD